MRKSPELAIDDVIDRWDESADLADPASAACCGGCSTISWTVTSTPSKTSTTPMEWLEDQLFNDLSRQQVQRRTFELRKSLVLLRRIVLPMREVVNALIRRDLHVVDDELMPYYQDVYDHVLRAAEWTDSLRDMVNGMLETFLTVQSNRLNVITKKLTARPL